MALRAVPDHPKFAELKAILRQPKGPTAGWLEMMWHFTGRFTPQGNIGKYTDQAIESWVEWDGEPGKLIEAFIQAKWIDRDPVHRLLVHDWHQHADKATKNALMRAGMPFCTPTVRTEYVDSTYKKPESGTVYRLPEPEPVPEPVPVKPVATKSLPPYVDEEQWDGFVEMRQKMHKVPFTERAKNGIIADLVRLHEMHIDPNERLSEATKRGWRGVLFDSDKNGHGKSAPPDYPPGFFDPPPTPRSVKPAKPSLLDLANGGVPRG